VQRGVVGVVDRGAGLVKLRTAATFSSCGSGWRRPPPRAAPGGVILLLARLFSSTSSSLSLSRAWRRRNGTGVRGWLGFWAAAEGFYGVTQGLAARARTPKAAMPGVRAMATRRA
jgi:hypothetical protein